MRPSIMFSKGLLLAACLAWVVAAPAQTSSSGITSTSPGDGPMTGPSYSPGDAPATPLGSALGMGTGNIGSSVGDRGSSFSSDSITGSGLGARSSGLGGGSGTGARSGDVAGSSTGGGGLTGSTAPLSRSDSTQEYIDQAELARCNGLAGAARGDCLDRLRDHVNMNSGVGARSAPGGRIGNGVGIAPGGQLPAPMVGPTLPKVPR